MRLPSIEPLRDEALGELEAVPRPRQHALSHGVRRTEVVLLLMLLQDLLAPFNYICELKGKEVRAAFIQAFNKVAGSRPLPASTLTRTIGSG